MKKINIFLFLLALQLLVFANTLFSQGSASTSSVTASPQTVSSYSASISVYPETAAQKKSNPVVYPDSSEKHNYMFEITVLNSLKKVDAIHVNIGSSKGSGNNFHGSFLVNNPDKTMLPAYCYYVASGNKYYLKVYLERVKQSAQMIYNVQFEGDGSLSEIYTGVVTP